MPASRPWISSRTSTADSSAQDVQALLGDSGQVAEAISKGACAQPELVYFTWRALEASKIELT